MFCSELCVPRAVHFCNTETNCSGHRERKREESWSGLCSLCCCSLFPTLSSPCSVSSQNPSPCHPRKVTEQRNAQLKGSELDWEWEDRSYLSHGRIGIQVLQTAVCLWQWRVLENKFHPLSSLLSFHPQYQVRCQAEHLKPQKEKLAFSPSSNPQLFYKLNGITKGLFWYPCGRRFKCCSWATALMNWDSWNKSSLPHVVSLCIICMSNVFIS